MKRRIFKGDALKKRIQAIVNELLFDEKISPGQITVKMVASRVPCSRVAIYDNNMASVIRLAADQKAQNAHYSDKLKKARKPRLIKLQDGIQELKKQVQEIREKLEVSEQLFNRLLINVMTNSNKLGITKEIDELLSTPIEALEFKRHIAFARRRRESLIEKLMRFKKR